MIFAPTLFACCKAITRLGLMFFSRLPPPTEKMKTASLASSLLIFSHSTKIVAQPSSLVRAVSSDTRTNDEGRSEEHTSELQSRQYLVCRLLLEKKKKKIRMNSTYTN